MIDKRLMTPEFNPLDDYALATSTELNPSARLVTLFDRAMLAAMSGALSNDSDFDPSWLARYCAECAIAFLEERAKRLGIEVTP